MPLVENLAVFFRDFGVPATLDGAAVTVILDEAGTTDLGLATTDPVATIATASVPASPYGKTLTVGARSFAVREHVPDGTGLSALVLSKA